MGIPPSLPPTPSDDRLTRYGQLVMQIGVPTVFAGVLLWFIITRLLANLDLMNVEMRNQTKLIEHVESLIADCRKVPTP